MDTAPAFAAGSDQRHALEKGAVVAGRLQAELAELLGQVGDGLGVARRAGRAAFELVGGERLGDDGERLGSIGPEE
jgi:hypothetical protein